MAKEDGDGGGDIDGRSEVHPGAEKEEGGGNKISHPGMKQSILRFLLEKKEGEKERRKESSSLFWGS